MAAALGTLLRQQRQPAHVQDEDSLRDAWRELGEATRALARNMAGWRVQQRSLQEPARGEVRLCGAAGGAGQPRCRRQSPEVCRDRGPVCGEEMLVKRASIDV